MHLHTEYSEHATQQDDSCVFNAAETFFHVDACSAGALIGLVHQESL